MRKESFGYLKGLYFFLLLLPLFCYSQDSSYWQKKYPNQYFQKGLNWDSPGNYEVAASLSKSAVYPNEEMTMQVYFTGYGIIGVSKVFMLFSDTVFSNESYLTTSIQEKINPDSSKKQQFAFGAVTSSISKDWGSIIMKINGLKSKEWPYESIYFDVAPFIIMSERRSINSPLDVHFFIDKDAKPGDYSIKLIYSYFNGSEWKSSIQTVPFHINTWAEEHYILAWLIGIIISLVGLITVIPTIIEFSSRFRKFAFKPKIIEENKEVLKNQKNKETQNRKPKR